MERWTNLSEVVKNKETTNQEKPTQDRNIEGQEKKEAKTIVVKGETLDESREWLNCSVIGEGLEPVMIDAVIEKLQSLNLDVEKVYQLDNYKVVITLKTVQEREQILTKGSDYLQLAVEETREWTLEENCKARRVQLECIDMPFHGWHETNFKNIGEVSSRYIDCDD